METITSAGTPEKLNEAGSLPNLPPAFVWLEMGTIAPSRRLPRWQSLEEEVWGGQEILKPQATNVVFLTRGGNMRESFNTKF